uniref:Uncharacterized protein n=1 Tax=Arundo donax TaxID=35708 RepID=A0A0A8YAU3_ARUDO
MYLFSCMQFLNHQISIQVFHDGIYNIARNSSLLYTIC